MENQEAPSEESDVAGRLERLARETHSSFFAEFVYFLRTNKKWWLAPIVILLMMIGLLVVLSGTAAAPFIYTLF